MGMLEFEGGNEGRRTGVHFGKNEMGPSPVVSK